MLWHELHETVPVDEKRGSMYNFLPNETFSGVVGLSAGTGATSGSACHAALAVVDDIKNVKTPTVVISEVDKPEEKIFIVKNLIETVLKTDTCFHKNIKLDCLQLYKKIII